MRELQFLDEVSDGLKPAQETGRTQSSPRCISLPTLKMLFNCGEHDQALIPETWLPRWLPVT
ncbi:hypothetical protein REMIM1_PC00073 (plasmid) [Rhizobium etli bv. mimosae str. Mim1]|nr:hypothetical protein REMIM1_PC00073 [Rhizobium etli bv. mimosae str. Mim1]